jgi:hypothetical protein
MLTFNRASGWEIFANNNLKPLPFNHRPCVPGVEYFTRPLSRDESPMPLRWTHKI